MTIADVETVKGEVLFTEVSGDQIYVEIMVASPGTALTAGRMKQVC
jgi:hypothetical protein